MRRYGFRIRTSVILIGYSAILAFAGALLTTGCTDDDPVAPEEQRLEFTVTFEPSTLVMGQSVTVTVAAMNPTGSDVHIGAGSSSCALDALVEFEGGDHGMVSDRVCTADMTERYIRAGETRTESWDWSGVIWQERGQVTLPAGTYQVAGAADGYTGEPVGIEIEDPGAPDIPRLDVTITVEPSVFTAGEIVQLTVTAENTLAVPVVVRTASVNCPVMAIVLGPDGGRFLLDPNTACLPMAGSLEMLPGEREEKTWEWSGLILDSNENRGSAAGTYSITGFYGQWASPAVEFEIID